MKKLSIPFVITQGFKHVDTIHEEDFYYKEYELKCGDTIILLFFQFFKDGKTSFSANLFDGIELYGLETEDELKTLIKILTPKS